jgi:glycosyltransferase involved in cell wall biosynthesis
MTTQPRDLVNATVSRQVQSPPMVRKPTVSLVIPMFNEELNIEHAITAAVEALQKYSDDYEVIIVDDASTDGSPQFVARMTTENPRIRTIRHDKNRKLGGALKSGYTAASKDLVLYMDADLPFDPDVLGRAIRAMDVTGADLIAGYRLDRTIEGLRRTIYSYVYNAIIGVLFGWPHRDINFSFKLMKREVLEAIELKSEGSLIDAELIVKAKNRGFAIQQIGLDYFPRIRGTSHLSSPAVILKIFRELVTLYPEMRKRVPRESQPLARPRPVEDVPEPRSANQ